MQCHGQKKKLNHMPIRNYKDKRWKNIFTGHFYPPCLFKYNFLNSSKLQERASLVFFPSLREGTSESKPSPLPSLHSRFSPLYLLASFVEPFRLRNSKYCCVIIPYFFPFEEPLLLPFPPMTHIPLPPSILTDFPPSPRPLSHPQTCMQMYI